MNVLVVSSYDSIVTSYDAYVDRGELPEQSVFYLVEYFDKPLPADLPINIVPVGDFANPELVAQGLSKVEELAKIDRVVTDDEYGIYVAALARSRWSLPGLQPADVPRFRDKVAMKKALGDRVAKPQLFSVNELKQARGPLPLIAKPRAFAASTGVELLRTESDLERALGKCRSAGNGYRELDENDLQFEEYIEGEVLHLDGILHRGNLEFFCVSQYFGTCMDFTNDHPVGSIMLPSARAEEWRSFAVSVVDQLQVPDGVFHLEAFQRANGEAVFLEIAIRPAGAQILPAIKAATGIDLRLAHFQLQLDCYVGVEPERNELGGWLIFPKVFSSQTQKAVVRAELPVESQPASLVSFSLPSRGDRANGAISYANNLGQFVLSAPLFDQLEQDLEQIRSSYKLELTDELEASNAN